jgi:hypothetical protein
MRRLITTLCIVALITVPACTQQAKEVLGGYYVEGDKVFWYGGIDSSTRRQEVADADADSFKSIDNYYATDKSHVFQGGTVLAGADPASFQKLDGFTKDRSHVWQGDIVISTDPANFEVFDGGGAKDSTAVYCNNGSLLSSDPTHFEILQFENRGSILSFSKDSRAVYYGCDPIDGADPATFRRLDNYGGYASDDRRVYWLSQPITDADPRTFRVLNSNDHCAADQQHAYKRELVIPNLDPAHFPPGQPVTRCSETDVTFGQ